MFVLNGDYCGSPMITMQYDRNTWARCINYYFWEEEEGEKERETRDSTLLSSVSVLGMTSCRRYYFLYQLDYSHNCVRYTTTYTKYEQRHNDDGMAQKERERVKPCLLISGRESATSGPSPPTCVTHLSLTTSSPIGRVIMSSIRTTWRSFVPRERI